MRTIDLRSDTMSHPTAEMWKAMAEAEVGDEVYGEDPTVNRLEAMAAERLEKEAAVFVSSGTMANLVGVLAHCQPGDEIVVGDDCHIFKNTEGKTLEALGGVRVRPVPNGPLGVIDPGDVEAAIHASGAQGNITSVVCLENTHNLRGGAVLDSEDVGAVAEIAHRHGASLYLDGARLFNAAVALGVPAAELSRPADTVGFCLSKGLGCPAGSLVCGTAETIQAARGYKKMLGGGMRQIGILAAAGVVALGEMVDRLAEDHANAKRLALGLADLSGLSLDAESVQTNIVLFEVLSLPAQEFVSLLAQRGVLINPRSGQIVRMLTHPGIHPDDVEEALKIVESVTGEITS